MRGPAPFIAIVVLTFLAFASALGHAPVWDDRIYIFDNPVVEEARWGEIGARPTGSYHRPVVFSTFALERAWLRSGPAAMRLTNVALHAAVACVLLLAALRLGAPRAAAAAGALLFALHPVQTEAVTYISGRTDLLAALFSLLALLLHARWRNWRSGQQSPARPAALAGALSCYLLALGSKESAAALPLAFLAGDFVFRDGHAARRSSAARIASLTAGFTPYALLLGALALWRAGLPGDAMMVDPLSELAARIPPALAAVGEYARLLLFPVNLHLERFVSAEGAALTLSALARVVVLLTLLRGGAQVRFWLVWAAVAYLPVANIVPVYAFLQPGVVFAPEHFLYLPSTGLLVLAALAAGGRIRGRAGPALLGAVLVCFLLITQARNRDWRDEETLYRHTLRFSPGSARIALNLGNIYFDRGYTAEAYDLWKQSLRRNPDDADLLTNAGLAALRTGEMDEAGRLLSRVVDLEPGDAQGWANLGAAHGTAGRVD